MYYNDMHIYILLSTVVLQVDEAYCITQYFIITEISIHIEVATGMD